MLLWLVLRSESLPSVPLLSYGVPLLLHPANEHLTRLCWDRPSERNGSWAGARVAAQCGSGRVIEVGNTIPW